MIIANPSRARFRSSHCKLAIDHESRDLSSCRHPSRRKATARSLGGKMYHPDLIRHPDMVRHPDGC
ncbi:MAG: hypothetical protein K2Y20_15240, partial [Sphingomonas sp.]|nr:hypothetical protein [Sphingomonas sp.]